MQLIMANKNASRRTINRTREHALKQQSRKPMTVEGKESLLFKCTHAECNWWGWLPTTEIKVINGS